MAKILTSNKNYYDIADAIRQMKDVDTTYKPRQMASALKDIYSNEVEGTLPLTFQANGNNLLDYRIDGAIGGVGDRTNNLWNDSITTLTPASGITRTNNSYVIDKIGESANEIITLPFVLSENKTCNLSFDAYADENNTKIIIDGFPDNIYNSAGIIDSQVILTTVNKRYSIQLQLLNGNTKVRFYRSSTTTNSNISKIYLSNIQLEEGSTATDYEPYGYKVPVICGVKTTNIYLDSPIGANESISLSDTEIDIPTIDGANTLTIDTTVQPSNVYVQARKDPDEVINLIEVLEEEI